MGNNQILDYSVARRQKRKGCTRFWAALVVNAKAWEESGQHEQGDTVGCIHYPMREENVALEP